MADVSIKVGNRLPKLARQFLTDGVATDLTSATVTFDMWNASTGVKVIASGVCTVLNANNGNVEYAWTAGDAALPAGNYLGAFTATFAGSRLLTAPNNGMISIEFYADIASEWSYTGNPASRPIDKVRFLVGDTDADNQQIKDAEIQFLLDEYNGDAYVAGSNACEFLAARYSAKSDTSKSVGDLSLSTQYGDQASKWREQASALRALAGRNTPPSPRASSDALGSFAFTVGGDKNRS